MSGFVFYDENGNGTADPAEVVRLPGRRRRDRRQSPRPPSRAAASRFASVPNGTQTAQAGAASLPAYFTPGSPLSVGIPSTADVPVPAVLPIGSRSRPNVYLAFGDSITSGDGSSDENGYRDWLRAQPAELLGQGRHRERRGPGHEEQQGRDAGWARASPPIAPPTS